VVRQATIWAALPHCHKQLTSPAASLHACSRDSGCGIWIDRGNRVPAWISGVHCLQQQRLQWRVARRHAARRARKPMWEYGVQLSRTWRRATAGLSRWLPVDGSRCRCPSDSRSHHCGRRLRVAAAAPVAGRVLSVAANGCSGSVRGNAGVHDSNGSPLVPTFTLCTVGINSEADTVVARRQHAPQSALGLAPCLQVCSCFYARALANHPPTYSQLACCGGDRQVAQKEASAHKQARREHKRSSLRHEQDVVPVSA